MTSTGERNAEKSTLEYFTGNRNATIQSLITCLSFATIAHKDQKRKDEEKTPYINHPIGVAHIVSHEADLPNLDLLRGCLLHDTVEDTDIVIEDIFVQFGKYIGDLVSEVTDDKTLPKQRRKDLQIIHAQTASPQAKVVKLADKLYNLRDLERSLPEGWSEERRKEYFEWSFKVCNNLQGVCPEIEVQLDSLFKSKGLIAHQNKKKDSTDIPHWPKYVELKYLTAAADFAARQHSRLFVFDAKNGEPYINHLVSVAFIISEEGGIQDPTVLCASLLCDTVGKSNTSLDEIVAIFGNDVGKIVNELTYDHSQTVKDQFNIKKNQAITMSDAAKVISLASVVDDCRRLENFEPEGWLPGFKEQYIQWARELIDILAGSNDVLDKKLDRICVREIFENMKCNSMKINKTKQQNLTE